MIESLGENLIPVIAIGGTLTLVAIWVICATIDSMFKAILNTRLKTRLIERGYSAAEIARIVESGGEQSGAGEEGAEIPNAFRKPVPPIKKPAAAKF